MNHSTKKILVIDDDPMIIEAVTILLQEEGYQVESTSDGSYLLTLHLGPLPDLILLDALLSGKDGRDLTRILKKQTETAHIPVIMFSAHPNARETVKASGADDFIPKPFDIDELLTMIERHLMLH